MFPPYTAVSMPQVLGICMVWLCAAFLWGWLCASVSHPHHWAKPSVQWRRFAACSEDNTGHWCLLEVSFPGSSSTSGILYSVVCDKLILGRNEAGFATYMYLVLQDMNIAWKGLENCLIQTYSTWASSAILILAWNRNTLCYTCITRSE